MVGKLPIPCVPSLEENLRANRHSRTDMVVVPAIIEGVAMGVAALPFVLHRWDMYRWDRDHRHQHAPKGTNHSERLTVLLPVWNEATVMEKKLDNLAAQNQAMHLLVVDSASTDSTLELLNGWVSRHPSTFASVEVLRMEQRQEKPLRWSRRCTHLGQHADGLICMTDADAMLERGCLQRMMQWFADPMIGAVGAVPNRVGGRQDEALHRAAWEAMRLAESMVDSTPFLEGSCMMWRPSCLAIDDLHTGANADDAQIATSVRCQGWRAVADPLATFIDVAPSTVEGQRRQKLRRAQGLQRLLTRMRKRASGKRQGVFGRIFRRQHHFHVIMPRWPSPWPRPRRSFAGGSSACTVGRRRSRWPTASILVSVLQKRFVWCCGGETVAAEATARFLWLASGSPAWKSWLGP